MTDHDVDYSSNLPPSFSNYENEDEDEEDGEEVSLSHTQLVCCVLCVMVVVKAAQLPSNCLHLPAGAL